MELQAAWEEVLKAGIEIFWEKDYVEVSYGYTQIPARKSPKSTDIADERAKFWPLNAVWKRHWLNNYDQKAYSRHATSIP